MKQLMTSLNGARNKYWWRHTWGRYLPKLHPVWNEIVFDKKLLLNIIITEKANF